MTDRELLELVAAQVGNLTNNVQDLQNEMQEVKGGIKGLKGEVQGLKTEMQDVKGGIKGLKGEVADIKKRVIHIENDHGAKLDALFDGYKQNDDKLTRIEAEVSKHDEFILRRIK